MPFPIGESIYSEYCGHRTRHTNDSSVFKLELTWYFLPSHNWDFRDGYVNTEHLDFALNLGHAACLSPTWPERVYLEAPFSERRRRRAWLSQIGRMAIPHRLA